jgi:predicted negative regulator of RcsB-dependent stress response
MGDEFDHDKKKFWEKVKESPFVPAGILGTLGMIGYGVWDYKNRGTMSTSVYVMQYRVKAQSVIVGAMAIGVTFSVIKDLLKKKAPSA